MPHHDPTATTSVVGAGKLDHGRCSLIVTGPPGAGKSSVTREVARHLQRAALLDGDVVNRFIVSGRVWALGEPAGEAARQVRLCNANLCALATNFADAAFTPVIDWVIPDRDQLDYFLRTLPPLPVVLLVLAPRPEVCAERNLGRREEEQFLFDGHAALTDAMRTEFGDVGWWLDTSEMSLAETVDLVLARAAHASV